MGEFFFETVRRRGGARVNFRKDNWFRHLCALKIQREASKGRSNPSRQRNCASLVQPVLVLEFFRQVILGQILKVFVGQRVKLILKTDGEHAFDFILPLFLLKPFVLH